MSKPRVSLPMLNRAVAAPPPGPGRGRRSRVLMVYPQQGFSGLFIRHMPLSLLYASAELVKQGVDVEVFDARLHPSTWREELARRVTPDLLAVGISVMTGRPIESAIEIGRHVKALDPDVRVVWGGPHVTFAPESVLDEWSCDYGVSGYGSAPLYALVRALLDGRGDLRGIPGVSFREADAVASTPAEKAFEALTHREIPYHLIADYSPYGQLDTGRRVFSMYSVLGCPYQCTFCSSPAQYRGTRGGLWKKLDVAEVVAHIEFVVERFGADFIYFIDDDSFVNLAHVEGIIDAIRARGLAVKLGFRGARVNEIKKMSHAYLDKLAAAGTDIMHVGAESGSDRVLKMIKKDCTVQDILACNRKLAAHPEITVGYNFMIGLPSETLDEIRATRDLWLKLIEENPRAIIFTPNKFRPLPGTELFEAAVRDWGYTPPRTLEDWSRVELEADQSFPWYPEGMEAFCRMLFVTSYFVDDKITRFSSGATPAYKLLRAASALYAPLARARLEHGWDRHLIEYDLYQLARRLTLRMQSSVLWSAVRGRAAAAAG